MPPTPAQASIGPCYLPLWPLVPQEEVGGEGSLASGLDYCQRKLPSSLRCLGGWEDEGKDGRKSCLQHHHQPTETLPHSHRVLSDPSLHSHSADRPFFLSPTAGRTGQSLHGRRRYGGIHPPPQPFSWAYGLPTMRALARQD